MDCAVKQRDETTPVATQVAPLNGVSVMGCWGDDRHGVPSSVHKVGLAGQEYKSFRGLIRSNDSKVWISVTRLSNID
jgi:hypothetical protein